jgi:hypothetical protein
MFMYLITPLILMSLLHQEIIQYEFKILQIFSFANLVLEVLTAWCPFMFH